MAEAIVYGLGLCRVMTIFISDLYNKMSFFYFLFNEIKSYTMLVFLCVFLSSIFRKRSSKEKSENIQMKSLAGPGSSLAAGCGHNLGNQSGLGPGQKQLWNNHQVPDEKKEKKEII